MQRVITNIGELAEQLPAAMATCLAFFPDVDRTVGGWEGLTSAQSCLRTDAERDAYASAYSVVSQLWEALSPDSVVQPFEADYRWLTAVYESIKPSDLTGKLVWHALGAKTLELINQHVTVEVPPRTDLETIVLDANVIEELSTGTPPDTRARRPRKSRSRSQPGWPAIPTTRSSSPSVNGSLRSASVIRRASRPRSSS